MIDFNILTYRKIAVIRGNIFKLQVRMTYKFPVFDRIVTIVRVNSTYHIIGQSNIYALNLLIIDEIYHVGVLTDSSSIISTEQIIRELTCLVSILYVAVLK